MPRKRTPKPAIGTIECIYCASVSTVHRGATRQGGLLYYNCPECKCVQPRSVQAQEWIATHMTAQDAPAADPDPQPESDIESDIEGPQNPPDSAPVPTPARAGGFFGELE